MLIMASAAQPSARVTILNKFEFLMTCISLRAKVTRGCCSGKRQVRVAGWVRMMPMPIESATVPLGGVIFWLCVLFMR
jgi:hypothetical protein